MSQAPHTPKPPWLRKRLFAGPEFQSVRTLLRRNHLHTVCEAAACPNIWECFSRKTATFMILGDHCSRDCLFCAVAHGSLSPPDPAEPQRVAAAIDALGLDYVVITSVTRDDLPDYGAGHFAAVLAAVRSLAQPRLVELLIPDFQGEATALQQVIAAKPDVLNHNLETVPRLYSRVRPQASYRRSLELLGHVRDLAPQMPTKSGLMLGLGETEPEVIAVLNDLLAAGCRILTLGQYLQPIASRLPVSRYWTPEEFKSLREQALTMGFAQVAAGPFVRSSYEAKNVYERLDLKKRGIQP